MGEFPLPFQIPKRNGTGLRQGAWRSERNGTAKTMALVRSRSVSCELGLIETTGPTGGTQHREYWGGPANGQAVPFVTGFFRSECYPSVSQSVC